MMKNILASAILTISLLQLNAQSIIPEPAEIKASKAEFTITPSTTIVMQGTGLENAASFFNAYLQKYYGFQLKVTSGSNSAKNSIVLNYEKMEYPIPGAYVMNVNSKDVYIAGDNAQGTFYGIQTLIQLLPPVASKSLKVPAVDINDHPRFAYRGAMLDVCRHFFDVDFVKQYIDYLAMYKINTFHWHLTDDQGWRVEIKKYPKLTSVGAWRDGTIIGRYPGTGNDSIHYGGFYTQEQIKEVVKYAADRYITIIPEIEMPGHASAALTAYPNLGCTGGPYKVQQTWGVFDDVFCAGNDSVFTFFQDVMDEVIPLFPAAYVHVGGDECPKTSWKKCPKCQQRIKDQHLSDEHALQSYFVQRMEKYINSKGKKIIGWDEILEGGIAPNATVMSWRGEEGGIKAAKQNHDVIMTPNTYVYFDYAQTKTEDSVTIGGFIPLEKVYSYEPIPAVLDASQQKHVLGAQANLWTEYIGYPSKVEYQEFPRYAALSEVLWSPATKRDWKKFETKLPDVFKKLSFQKTNYSTAYYDIQTSVTPGPGGNGVSWKVFTNNKAGKLLVYNADKTTVDKATVYESPVVITDNATMVAVVKNADGTLGKEVRQTFSFNKATGKKVTITKIPDPKYSGNGGASGLINGVKAQRDINSPEWLGWFGGDCDATIDLGKTESISKVNVHILYQPASWIYPPKYVQVQVSSDGKNFTDAGQSANVVYESYNMGNITVNFANTNCRYIRVLAKNYGMIEEGKQGAGNKSWTFVSEIQID